MGTDFRQLRSLPNLARISLVLFLPSRAVRTPPSKEALALERHGDGILLPPPLHPTAARLPGARRQRLSPPLAQRQRIRLRRQLIIASQPASIRFSLLNPPVAVSNPGDHRVARHYFSRSQPIDSTSPSPFLPHHQAVDSSQLQFSRTVELTALPPTPTTIFSPIFTLDSTPGPGRLSPPTSCQLPAAQPVCHRGGPTHPVFLLTLLAAPFPNLQSSQFCGFLTLGGGRRAR
ncbi:hypothetical protein PVAP13_7KG210100 [Panicum virgatum]|uniref:Uncharacterized protein n=1 Tax=Panicum virgatum TaxID=38727 RepID=A0A8T0QID0_PANVG|nr:hypothetical protein PVAP13_7KG210100 [Panicum virgatum]